jgi:hypothetical protein
LVKKLSGRLFRFATRLITLWKLTAAVGREGEAPAEPLTAQSFGSAGASPSRRATNPLKASVNFMNAKVFWMVCLIALITLPALAHEEHAANDMAAAAKSLIASFEDNAEPSLVFAMDDEHRLDWHFIPKERKGVPMKQMTPQQQHFTAALLAASLSSKGATKVSSIMGLEQVLQKIEGSGRRFPRDPDLYHVSIFGEPGPGKTWGWRFEGHHLSLSFTVVNGQHISATPSFFGTNPAIVPDGPHKGLQILAVEENVARKLAKSLTSNQREKGILSETAPADILTENFRNISPLEPAGVGFHDLNEEQQELVWRLVTTYVRRARGEVAQADLEKITGAGKGKIHFAWAGGLKRGEGHYYRIQGPTFLIEYDNTQNNANHVHAVYRDFTEDFGEDLLKAHYEQAHR